MIFTDRRDAGRRLARQVRRQVHDEDVVVVALPRGGVPVAFEVAQELGAPLDVIVVRKLGMPYQPEYGFGAIGEGGVRILNPRISRMGQLTPREIEAVEKAERAELRQRTRRFRGTRQPVELAGRTVLVVDDGVATGGTVRAACQVVRARGADRVILAVPVGPPDVIADLREAADEVICLHTPPSLYGIGAWYHDFTQTTDAEVLALLDQATASLDDHPGVPLDADPPAETSEVWVRTGSAQLPGLLTVPDRPAGLTVFAHGSGSSRHSPRNKYVAAVLHEAGLATLLFDLLTPAEEIERANVFDIELLAGRLVQATAWLRAQPATARLPISYFGASTGAAAALWAAGEQGDQIAAVVSRGGRPDLAGPRLPAVEAATLLIVGGDDRAVLDLNRQAMRDLRCDSRLEIVPGAGHLFEEPGALEVVAELACDWFTSYSGHSAPSGAS
ncbi:phosphoribosyltransferase family protein [Nonomuraea sp. NPDC046570]|uniref:phosphoribosyltransferase family protein n=1 Tax=Nonomuraea sp. NPDC046570 TaxID=3155255 RepID=UPI0033D00779